MLDISKYEPKALKSETAILKLAAEIGTGNLTDQSVFERFATFCYAVGNADKVNKANVPTDAAKVFEAFNTPFRSGEGSLRKELKENSVKTWVSAFGAFSDAGRFTAYDMAPIVEKALSLDKQAYTSRGAKVRKVMADHPKAVPTDVELDKIFNPPSKADENPALTLAKRWLRTTSDEAVNKADADLMNTIKANPRQRIAMVEVHKAIKAFVAACEAGDTPAGMSADDEIAMLKAKLAAQANPPTVN
jgi:hypothetical protein